MTVRVRYQTVEFGSLDVHVRSLRNVQECPTDASEATAMGVPSAHWAVFGVLWDSGRALAGMMADYDLQGRRILEVGCGLALSSLVLNHRGSDITATDLHPEAGPFLEANVRLNEGRPLPFVRTGWTDLDDTLGTFDLIIGSDLLYEDHHIESLAAFIGRHANPVCEVILLDPRRGAAGRFGKHMTKQGFTFTRHALEATDSRPAYAGEVLRSVR